MDNGKPAKMENGEYSKKSGSSGSKGVQYQLNMLTVVLLHTLIKSSETTWKLSTENNNAGNFDDIVLEGQEGDVLVQTKSRENKEKKIKLDELLWVNPKNSDFSLCKYFLSYLEIKSIFRIKNLIICSNADVDEKVKKFLDQHRIPEDSMFDYDCPEGRKYFYTFKMDISTKLEEKTKKYFKNNVTSSTIDQTAISDVNIREFLEKLQFYINFAPERHLKMYTEKLLARFISSNNLFTKLSLKDVNKVVRIWFELAKGVYLTDSRAKAFLYDTLSKKYSKTLKKYQLSFSRNDFVFDNTKRLHHVIINAESEYLLYLLKVYQLLNYVSNNALYVKPNESSNIQTKILQLFKVSQHSTLVIVCPKITDETEAEDIGMTLKETLISSSSKKVVLVAKSDNVLVKQIKQVNSEIYRPYNLLVGFDSFSENTQKRLLKMREIKFQGATINLETLLKPLEKEDFTKYLSYGMLELLVERKTISIGTQIRPLEDNVRQHYITRELKREKDGEEISCSENDLYSTEEKLVLVTDFGGMGKSTLLIKLANEIKERYQHLWVIKIDLTDCTRVLYNALTRETKTIEIEELLDSHSDATEIDDFKRTIFSLKEKIVLLVDAVDEIDPEYTELVLGLLVKCQKSPNFAKIFVTTRPHASQKLEQRLGVMPFKLEPFTEDNQVKFLINYWAPNLELEKLEKSKRETYATQLLAEVSPGFRLYQWRTHFAGIPLFVRMLAEIFQKGCKEFLSNNTPPEVLPKNLAKLYDMFIEGKLKEVLEEENPNKKILPGQSLNNTFKENITQHEILAIDTFFGKDVLHYFTSYNCKNNNDNDNNHKSVMLKIGLVQGNGKCQFIHRTFGAYFAAKGLLKELQSQNATDQFKNFFIKYLVRKSGSGDDVIEFFDSCLEENCERNTLPSDIFHSCKSLEYDIDSDTFKQCVSIFHNLAEENKLFILQFLLKCLSAENNEERNEEIKTITVSEFTATESNDKRNLFSILQRLLQKGGINIMQNELCNYYGRTPLHIAALLGHLKMVQVLVNHGANICMKDNRGGTPLMIAAKFGHLDIIKFLVNCNNINCPGDLTYATNCSFPKASSKDCNAEMGHIAYVNMTSNNGNTALHNAATKNNLEILKELLKSGADINIKNKNGNTALHRAALYSNLDNVKFLMENGAIASLKNKDGETALYNAASGGDLEIFQLLVVNDADIRSKNKNGDSVLHFAASKNCPKIIQFLLENDVDVNTQNNNGETVLHRAASYSRLDIIKYIIEHGADINSKNKRGETALCFALSKTFPKIFDVSLQNSRHGSKSNYGNFVYHEVSLDDCLKTVRYLIAHSAEINTKNIYGVSPLHRAVLCGYLDTLKILVKQGAEINVENEYGNTALYNAVSKDMLDIVEFLVKNGANVKTENKNGDTILHAAVLYSGLDIIKLIVERGADVNVQNKDGNSVLYNAVSRNDSEIVEFLLQKGAHVNTKNKFGETLLHRAALCGCLGLINLFLEKDIDVNMKNKYGNTALHIAALENYSEIIKSLKRKGAYTNIKNNNGDTGLHLAALYSCTETVKCLLSVGAEVDIKNRQGNTALHLAASKNNTEIAGCLVNNAGDVSIKNKNADTLLHRAVSYSCLATTKYFVKCGVINVNSKNKCGNTALHIAASKNYYEIVNFLLENGADIDMTNDNGDTALHSAALYSCEDIVRCLVEKGAQVNSKNKHGNTALHLAASKNYSEVVDILVEKGSDLDMKNKKGDTALHLSALNRCVRTLENLIKRSADANAKNNIGDTALHLACSKNCSALVEVLINGRADINIQNRNGNTALHTAGFFGHWAIFQLLVAKGANVKIKNQKRDIP